jgi:hypothetical protein
MTATIPTRAFAVRGGVIADLASHSHLEITHGHFTGSTGV